MQTLSGRCAAALMRANNGRVRAADPEHPNPRRVDALRWVRSLESSHPVLLAEWRAERERGLVLPLIDDLLGENQGNHGPWRAGLLISDTRPCSPLADRFPATLAALGQVPGLRAALWSELEPGTELPEHRGPNAGVLRYHLGIDCPPGSALVVGSHVHRFRNGGSVLFDDTAPHAASNRGTASRVTLFCEILRPLTGLAHMANRATQALLAADPRYRHAPLRAAEWHAALNP